MVSPEIKGGYFIKARVIQESDIARCSPVAREIWDWLLMNANHHDKKYGGFLVKRGQLFRTYLDIREGLSWNVGYRKKMYNEDATKKAMKKLRSLSMIATTKAPGGVLITIINYNKYQDPKNYEGTNEGTNEGTMLAPSLHQGCTTLNKNEKNEENKSSTFGTCNNSSSSPDEQPEKVLAPKKETVPYQEIIALYHRILPELMQVRKLTANRKGILKARWNDSFINNKGKNVVCNSVEFWEYFFGYVRDCPWLMGKVEPGEGGKQFIADLFWMLKAENFAKIVEGKYQ